MVQAIRHAYNTTVSSSGYLSRSCICSYNKSYTLERALSQGEPERSAAFVREDQFFILFAYFIKVPVKLLSFPDHQKAQCRVGARRNVWLAHRCCGAVRADRLGSDAGSGFHLIRPGKAVSYVITVAIKFDRGVVAQFMRMNTLRHVPRRFVVV